MISIVHIILSLVSGQFRFILLTENCGGPFIELFLEKWSQLDLLYIIFGFGAITVFTICNFCVNFILQVFIKELANQNRKSLQREFMRNTIIAIFLKLIYNFFCFILAIYGITLLDKKAIWPYLRVSLLFLLELFIDIDMLRLYKNVMNFVRNISF